MDVRPQAHDIIRTWLFSTLLRSEFEHGTQPVAQCRDLGLGARSRSQEDVEVEGECRHADGLLEEHGSDGVRYWAASGRPGADTAFDPGQMRVGRRLAIKILNASKFVLSRQDAHGPVTAAVDRGLLTKLAAIVDESTADLENYNYTRVLERTEIVLLVLL